jgi:imidazole glycerol-phosphate synthase subunit HisH
MIAVVDYGLGNVRAIRNIYYRANIPCEIVSDPEALACADRLVLPGVGAFDWAMNRLNASGMRRPLDDLVLGRGVPVLGICVGMQMIAKGSEEGTMAGLGWIDAQVVQFRGVERPHMGWNSVTCPGDHALLDGVDVRHGFYFLHSYHVTCSDDLNVLASCDHGGAFTAAVCDGHVHGVQFHPEKSHHNGTRVFLNFARL